MYNLWVSLSLLQGEEMKGKEVKKFTYDENRSALDNFKLWLYENGNERYWNEEKPLQYKDAVNIFERQYCVKLNAD